VYLREGQVELLPLLLESVLAHFKVHTALWQFDVKDPFIQLLNSHPMGWLSQFQPGVTTHVMVKAVDLPPAIQLGKEPVYVSSFDYT
ncbi:MAG: hypothetical protein EOO39_51340, partial [Cytophagaceae bacterium]